MNRIRHSILMVLLIVATTASGRQFVQRQPISSEQTLNANGAVVIENPFGSIHVIGTDGGNVSVSGEKVVKGVEDAMIAEGMRLTQLEFVGSNNVRVIRTRLPRPRDPRWSSVVNYTVRMPRTASLKIASYSADQIRVSDIRGTVTVENTSGTIMLERVIGGVFVRTINGNITMHAPARVIANATLMTTNGKIQVHAPDDANFQWEGEVLSGDAKTTFTPRVQIAGTRFRGVINSPSGPILRTDSVRGSVYMLRSGTTEEAAQSIRTLSATPRQFVGPIVRPFVVERLYTVHTNDNVAIGEVRGSADIRGGGEIRLGSVAGRCSVFTTGGPLNLGDILGVLNARTEGGDVLVQSAREGGSIATGGGMIRLLFAAGPTRLMSGGGDIIVRQTTAPVIAETRSGDITVTVDSSVKSEQIWAKTAKGNIVLNVPQRFAADIEATIVTSDPNTHQIRSELGNLSVQREQVPGGKTRIRATGKVNGGGDRVELFAEDGGIQIMTSPR
jgi:hypothetical protein